jgi:nitrate/nitrite transport system ATP-binding protein
MLELVNVSKAFGTGSARVDVLRDIRLSVAPGEFVAIVGYSGAGKTTLINLMAGLIHPDSGEVRFKGSPGISPGPERAVIFQNYSLLPWLTVFGNIALAVNHVFSDWPGDRRRVQVERCIATVNLSAARDKRPHQLSGGMRQRVSVARALAINPELLLLDEPLGALDALTRASLQDEIGRICRVERTTAILITNDPDEGIYLADRIIPMTAGPGATLGPPITVDIPHPRDRHALNHDSHFRALRAQVTDYLLGTRGRPRQQLTRRLVLPDIEPEDLTVPRSLFARRRPRRRTEEHRETLHETT